MHHAHKRAPRLITLLTAGILLAACHDAPPLAVTAPDLDPSRHVSTAPSGHDDLTDLLDRVLPAVADEHGIEAVAAATKQLIADEERGDRTAAARTAERALEMLERVEARATGAANADLGTLRVVLESHR